MAEGESPQRPTKPPRWFCRIDGKEVGPVTDMDLRRLARAGKLTQTSDVRKGPTGKWVPAAQVKGLFPAEAKAVEAVVETEGEQSFDPLASDWIPASNELDPQPASVPVLAFANLDALTSASPTGALVGGSPKVPPPRSVYAAQTLAAPAQQAVSNSANANERAKNEYVIWIAVGAGGLLLLALIIVGAVWMLGTDESVVADATNGNALRTAPTTPVPEASATTADDAARTSPAVTDGVAIDPFAESALSEPTVKESGEEVAAAPVPPAEPRSKPEVGASSPRQAAATTDESTLADLGDVAAKSSATMREPAADPPLPVADAIAAEPTPDAVAPAVPPEPAAGDERTDRARLEASEAAKLVLEIDANVRQRLQQIAEREALVKQSEANRAEYQRVVAAIGIATNDLPKMQRQYIVLEDSHREAAARALSDRNFVQARVGLEREMATLAQQIVQVTSVGNAAVRAKPGLEQQWAEQNKQLAGLQQREGLLHQKLMAALDPFGQHAEQYRDQLIAKGADWGTSCVEAALIRGLVQFHDARLERAVEDFSSVLTKLDGVLKQKRIAKDSPELKVVQTALAARGFALFKLGKEPEGIADLGKAVGANELYTLPLVFRGMVEAQRERHEAAFRDFDAARRLNDPHASREAARLFVTSSTQGNPARALTLAKDACDLETSWSNQEVLATALAANGQNALAREAYREAASRAPVDQSDRLTATAASLPE